MEPASRPSHEEAGLKLNADGSELPRKPVEHQSDKPSSLITREERELEQDVALARRWMAKVADRHGSS